MAVPQAGLLRQMLLLVLVVLLLLLLLPPLWMLPVMLMCKLVKLELGLTIGLPLLYILLPAEAAPMALLVQRMLQAFLRLLAVHALLLQR